MTTALEKVIGFAAASSIPEHLMPDGWMAWEADPLEVALAFGFSPMGMAEPGMEGLDRGEDVRHVRTEAGVLLYKAPIGTPITDRMREAAQGALGKSAEKEQYDKEGAFEKAEAGVQKKSAAIAKKAMGPAPTAVNDAVGAAEGKAGAAGKPAPPQHPANVSGHAVQKVYSHAQTKRSLYDLGHGLHAEGEGGKAGPVMRSPTGLNPEALAQKGWKGETLKPKPNATHPGAVPKRGLDWACLKPPCAPGTRLKVNTDHTVTKRGSGRGAIIGHIGEHANGNWTFRHAASGTASKPFAKSPEEAAHHLAEYHNAKALAAEHDSKPFLKTKYEAAAFQIAHGNRGDAASKIADALNSGTNSSVKGQAESLRDSLLSSEPTSHIPVPENLHGQSAPQTESDVKDLLRRTDVDEGVQRHVQDQINKLKEEMDNERSKDSKAKLAFHSGVLLAGIALMVLLTHAGVAAVPAAAIGGSLPFGTEFIDRWKRWV